MPHRLDGPHDEPRPGTPRTIGDEAVEAVIVIVKTLEETPVDATHWSTRSMAEATGMSQSTVSRIWRAFGLKPRLVDTLKLSPDPQFVERVRDIVGLYLNPPEGVEEGRRIANALGHNKAVILSNHGLLTVGESIDEAGRWFLRLEGCCQVQLLAEAAAKPRIIDGYTAAQVYSEQGTHLARWFTYQPLFEQVAEAEPDLFG